MCDEVTAEDVQRVANAYFSKDQRNVLIINTKATEEGQKQDKGDARYQQAVQMIESIDDPDRLEQMIGMFASRMDQVEDPERRARMEELLKLANERLKKLRAEQAD